MKTLKRMLAAFLVMVILCVNDSVVAQTDAVLTIPAAVEIIEAGTFYGSTSISKVVLSDNVKEIRARAFASSSLSEINLPDSLTFIAEDAFDGPDKVTVTVNPGTYAYDWAVSHNYIDLGLMISSLEMDKEEYAVGETANWTAVAQYGTAPYRYQFALYKDTTRIKQSSYSTNSTYSYTFTEAGTYHMVARVRDSEYTVSEDYIGEEFVVTEPESGLKVTAVPNQESAYLYDNISWTATAEGGVEPYRYSFKLFIDGKQSATQTYSTNNLFSTDANTAADYTLQVDVLDAENNGATFTTEPFTVLLEELRLDSFYVDLPEAQTEDTIHWYAQAAGGQDPYTYAYQLKKGNTTIDTKAASEETSYEYTTLEAGTYTLTVTATDAVGHTATASADSVVTLRPVAIVDISATSNTYMTDEPVTWTVTAEGGDRSYTYAFTLYKDEEELDFRGFEVDNTFTYTPEEAGVYSVEVTVRDSAKNAASQSGGEVTISIHPLEIVSVTTDSEIVRLGNTVTLTTEVIGGLTPLRYSYEVYDANKTLVTASTYSLSASYTYTASASGDYTFKVKVRDAESTVVEAVSKAVNVYDPLSITGITASAASVLSGEGVTWTAERIGGKGPIIYDWYIYREDVLEYTERNTLGSVRWTPLMSGAYTARAVATDEEGEAFELTGGLVESSAHSATPQSEFSFSVLNGSFCSLTKYNGTDSSVIIPGEWTDENGVTRIVQTIAGNAFKDNKNVTSVIIADSVETMGSYVFSGCSNLIYVKGGKKLTNIGDYTFQNCTNLKGYDFEPATTSIGSYAFRGCTSITHFKGWNGLKNIGSYAFHNNNTLQSVNLPEGLTTIDSYAFQNCTGLTSVHIPDSVETMSSGVFSGCSSLSSANYPINWKNAGTTSPYANCPKLTRLVIPEGVTAIPQYAFHDASNFNSITLPNTLKSMGKYAFQRCTGLRSITIPSGVTVIPDEAFRGCMGLTSVNLPEGLITIGSYAFLNCTGLTSVNLPEGLTTIDSYAFQNCTGLTSVHIPDSVETMSSGVFSGCSSLSSANYPINWKNAGTTSPYANCPKLTRLVIPEGVTAIPQYAFRDASNFNSITLPSTLKSIGEYAFAWCTGLRSITIPSGVTVIPDEAFRGCTGLTSVNLTEGLITIGSYAFLNCTGLASVNLPEGLTTIYSHAFDGCTGLTSVNLPEGLTTIDSYAFQNCTGLTSVHIPDSVETMSSGVFSGCSSLSSANYPINWKNYGIPSPYANCPKLTRLVIPEGVTAIPQYAFHDASNFNSITLPRTLKSIGEHAFQRCTGLRSITIPSGVTVIPYSAFSGCTGLTSVNLPEDLITIGSYAFQNCTGLMSVNLPEGLTTIYSYAFNGCTGLTSVNLTEGLITIGSYAFLNCTGLTSVNLPEGLTTIYSHAFDGCTGLTSVNLPEGLTTIESYAFQNCTRLTSVHIPDSVETMSSGVFSGCSSLSSANYPINWKNAGTPGPYANCPKLTRLVIPEGVTAIPASAFAGCSSIETVILPYSLTTIGSNAFSGCTNMTAIWIDENIVEGSIGNYAFQNCSTSKLVIHGIAGSYAETWANANGYVFSTERVSERYGSLYGRVIDTNGDPISNAYVMFYPYGDTIYERLTMTGEDGTWEQGELSLYLPYKVSYAADGYTFADANTSYLPTEAGKNVGEVIGTFQGIENLVISVTEWTGSSTNAQQYFTVESSEGWYIDSIPDWATVYRQNSPVHQQKSGGNKPERELLTSRSVQSSGSMEGVIVLDNNDTLQVKTGELIIRSGARTATMRITQQADIAAGIAVRILFPEEQQISVSNATALDIVVSAVNFRQGILKVTDPDGLVTEYGFEAENDSIPVVFYKDGDWTIEATVWEGTIPDGSDTENNNGGATSGIYTVNCYTPDTAQSAPATRTSEAGIALIKEFEGFQATPYKDGIVRIDEDGTVWYKYSYGNGRQLPGVYTEDNPPAVNTSAAEADIAMRATIAEREVIVNRKLQEAGVTLNQYQYDAIMSLCYNFWPDTVLADTRIWSNLKKYKSGNAMPAWLVFNSFVRWHHETRLVNDALYDEQTGAVQTVPVKRKVDVNGLMNRRLSEATLFTTGVYEKRTNWDFDALGMWWFDKTETTSGYDVPDEWYKELKPEQLTLSKKDVHCSAEGGEASLTVKGSASWTASPKVNWITVYKGNDGTLILNIQPNTDQLRRTGTVIVIDTGANYQQSITVAQEGTVAVGLTAYFENQQSEWKLGDAHSYKVHASGGDGSYTYTYQLVRLKDDGTYEVYTPTKGYFEDDRDTINVKPDLAGTYWITGLVHDGNGETFAFSSQLFKVKMGVLEYAASDGDVYDINDMPKITWTDIGATKYLYKIVDLAKAGTSEARYVVGSANSEGVEAKGNYVQLSKVKWVTPLFSYFEESHTYRMWVGAYDKDGIRIAQKELLFSTSPLQQIQATLTVNGNEATEIIPCRNDIVVAWDAVVPSSGINRETGFYRANCKDLTENTWMQYLKTNCAVISPEDREFTIPWEELKMGHSYTLWIAGFTAPEGSRFAGTEIHFTVEGREGFTGEERDVYLDVNEGEIVVSDASKASYINDFINNDPDYSIWSNRNQKYNLQVGRSVIYFFEGAGINSSTDARQYALCVVVRNDEEGNPQIVFKDNFSTTVPDAPKDPYWNGGRDVPIVKDGIYNVYTVNHFGYRSLRIGSDKVIRFNNTNHVDGYEAESGGIHIHRRSYDGIWKGYRKDGTPTANSTGCFLVGRIANNYEKYKEFITKLETGGGYDNTTSNMNVDMGVVIVDRTLGKEYIEALYGEEGMKKILGIAKTIDEESSAVPQDDQTSSEPVNVFNTKDMTVAQMLKKVDKSENTEWSGVGKVRYLQQASYSANDYYYSSYWDGASSHACDVCVALMGLSYMGYNTLPKDLPADVMARESGFSDQRSNRIKYIGEREDGITAIEFETKSGFINAYNQYANDSTGNFSPIMVFTRWGNGGTSWHALIILCRDAEQPDTFLALDPGAGKYFQQKRIRFTEVGNDSENGKKWIIQDVYFADGPSNGKKSTIYGTKYTPVYFYQFRK